MNKILVQQKVQNDSYGFSEAALLRLLDVQLMKLTPKKNIHYKHLSKNDKRRNLSSRKPRDWRDGVNCRFANCLKSIRWLRFSVFTREKNPLKMQLQVSP